MLLSVIIPVYNERSYIECCLDSIIRSLSDIESYEVIVSDGGSNDGTKEVLSKYESEYQFVKVMENKKKLQVYALNSMIGVSEGEYIVRCDAHAIYPVSYFKTLISVLKENPDYGNVGLPVDTVPSSSDLISTAIAINLNSKFGVGLSHRTLDRPIGSISEVDTVLFGAWRSKIFQEIGDFDESYIRGQDYEHNIRVRKAGYHVVQIQGDPIKYFARDKYSKLFNMMKQYASVKPRIYFHHGMHPGIRAFIPFGFYAFLGFSIFVDNRLFSVALSLYLMAAVFFSIRESISRNRFSMFPFVMFGYVVQHLGHAYGFSLGCIHQFFGKSSIEWDGTR